MSVQAQHLSDTKINSLRTSFQILHLFVLDLLGRTTPAAKIFLTKTDSE